MIDLKRPITELVGEVAKGAVTAAELVRASLEAIEEFEDYHAILEVNPEALSQAKAVDEAIAAGQPVGRLAGIPFIAKDNFLTRHTHTTAASDMLRPFQSPYGATAVQRLEGQGAIMVAKANLDAFGHGGSTENSDFGPTQNPHDKKRVPGGSSGGSAAAVALGLACFALGTDTGGSSRQPAALSGVVGFKPTYGLISRYGVVAMGSSFDTVGILGNRTTDVQEALDVMAGKDPQDATTIDRHDSYVVPAASLKGKKIGLIQENLEAGTEEVVKTSVLQAVDLLRGAGATVEKTSLPSVDLALACYYILVPAEISSNLARYDGIRYGHSSAVAKTLEETYALSRDEGFGVEAKRRILIGTYVLSSGYYDAYYKQAQKVRTLLKREFEKAFSRYDLLLGPTAPTTAFKLGEKNHDPLAMYAQDIDTVAVNLIGVPAVSIPCGTSNGLPIGLQFIGPQRGERELLATAAAAEKLLGAAV